MSKKYILLTGYIFTVGGGQIYCQNKAQFCKSVGYEVFIFSTQKGKIEIEHLKKYADLICDRLYLNPHFLPKKTVDCVLKWIREKINYNENDNIVIESHAPNLAVWGEMLAKTLNAKHIVYLYGERYVVKEDLVRDLLAFKYSRKELASITPETIKNLFNEYDESCCLKAALGNPVADIDIPEEYVLKVKSKKVIGIIGRSNKQYVLESLKKSCEFSEIHNEDKFVVVLVGNISKQMQKRMKVYSKSHSNVNLIFAGNQFPIPKKLLLLMDVALAAAGCVKPPYMFDVPTISVDVYDNEAIGVYGYDTTVRLKRETESKYKIIDYLEKILYGDFLEKNVREELKPTDFNEEYKLHFKFIDESSKEKEYYNFESVVLTKKERLNQLLYFIGGVKIIRFFKETKSKIRKLVSISKKR